ncbi:chromosome partitioning protein ParB [Aureimonas ureilytica]|uniref:Chromosome partitioning protein ParB n=1 Tax=Aureimonas ureilytica TaxID=401562 RepID=A0A175RWK8_9HYPH|nr:plasmid partitioning protein RepB [Aureimonas ureilytica]KTR08185.1 chromosome partitioning protein ParB [Aureimonas ureilytica]
MARKNLLGSLIGDRSDEGEARPTSEARAQYARRGATRSMMQTLDEMAEDSMLVMEGSVIVDLDPHALDASPYADRIGDDEEDFQALLGAIRESGQHSPILVRPHPVEPQRYVIVYGHRRAKVARALGISVRAIVKPLEDIAHVIAQGQENSARADLSFVEKALFARKLLRAGIGKDDVKKALTIDDTLLSRMLGIAESVPEAVLEAVGAAKGVGRDRWEAMKKALQNPRKAASVMEFLGSGTLSDTPPDQRFNVLLEQATKAKARHPASARLKSKTWTLAGSAVKVGTKDSGRAFTMAIKAKEASAFGEYISENLDRLYEDFRKTYDRPAS